MTFLLLVIVFLIIWAKLSGYNTRLTRVEKQLKDAIEGKVVKVSSDLQKNTAPVAVAEIATDIPQKTERPAVVVSDVPQQNSEETSGKVLGRIGIAAVIVGISFFLKYAFDNNWIGEAGRVTIGVIIGIALLAVGQYLRKKYLGYSDLLMGGGVGVLYLAIFSANFFYHLISPATAGVFMFLVTVLAFAISIVNATPVLAMVSVIGGFATPFLVQTRNDNMIELFGYLTLINIGILGISLFKKWPQLIAVAFIGTVINFSAWYSSFYSESVLGPTLIFCFTSFLIFLFASVARSITAKASTDQLNYFLLGINAFSLAVMGYIILEPQHHNVLGFSSVGIALIFMAVAFVVNKFNPEDKTLNIFLPGLAVTFLSVAVPLQFTGPWIAVAWFVESVMLYIIASFIGNRGFQVMGVVVYVLGLLNFFMWNFPKMYDATFIPFFNSHFLTLVLAVAGAYAIAYMYYRFGSLNTEIQKRGIMVFIVIANILSVYGLSAQIIFSYNAKLTNLEMTYREQVSQAQLYNTGYDTSGMRQDANSLYYTERQSISNRSHTFVSILWVVYAAILTAIGFGYRLVGPRRLGLILFLITAIKVITDVWSLGQLYRIISFTVFGVIALVASFAYAKYKDRLKDIV